MALAAGVTTYFRLRGSDVIRALSRGLSSGEGGHPTGIGKLSELVINQIYVVIARSNRRGDLVVSYWIASIARNDRYTISNI